MLSSLIFFIVAFISLGFASTLPPVSPFMAVSGTTALILLAWVTGKMRIRQLHNMLDRSHPEDPRILNMFMQWKTIFQFTVIVLYISSVLLFKWGSFINITLGLKHWILVDEILGLFPYFILLFVYWSLSYDFQNRVSREKWSYKGYIEFNFHLALTPVLPLLFYVGMMDSIYYLPYKLSKWVGPGSGIGELTLAFGFLTIVGILFPLILVRFWKCKPIEPGEKRYLLESVCKARGLKYRDILLWDIGEGKFLNAAVLGVIGQFRYILFTRKLLDVMSEGELIAVLGHETGHAKKHHILMNVLISFGFLSFFIVFSTVISSILYKHFPGLGEVSSFVLPIVTVVLYWRVIFGFISRRFEREADIYGAEVAGGAEPMISALEKLAVMSGRPRDIPDWTHYSVAERVDFLRSIEHDPVRKVRFNLETSRMMKKMVVTAVILFITSFVFMAQSPGQGAFPLDQLFEQQKYAVIEEYLLEELKEKELTAKPMQRANLYNNLAWLYATSRDSYFRKPRQALVYAREAVLLVEGMLHELQTEDERTATYYYLAIYTDTLAAAHFALGDNRRALEFSGKALELFPEGLPGIEDLIKTFEKHKKAAERGDTYI